MARSRDRERSSTANKPQARNDAYTIMLLITFLAIVAGCVLLYLDFDEYGQNKAPTTALPAVQKLGDAPTATSGGAKGDTGGKAGTDAGSRD